MFKAPSRAKGSPIYRAAALSAPGAGVEELLDSALLAARIEHFISIGGQKAREYFLGNTCCLAARRISRLSRRMPPFIAAKLDELYAGSANVDSNPSGAFDTNGWAELKVRLPKFAAVLAQCARQ